MRTFEMKIKYEHFCLDFVHFYCGAIEIRAHIDIAQRSMLSPVGTYTFKTNVLLQYLL